jgi:hypothetical protein
MCRCVQGRFVYKEIIKTDHLKFTVQNNVVVGKLSSYYSASYRVLRCRNSSLYMCFKNVIQF